MEQTQMFKVDTYDVQVIEPMQDLDAAVRPQPRIKRAIPILTPSHPRESKFGVGSGKDGLLELNLFELMTSCAPPPRARRAPTNGRQSPIIPTERARRPCATHATFSPEASSRRASPGDGAIHLSFSSSDFISRH